MKALPTQFDDRRLATAVATPTCSSCCCCCCCLATSIASSSLLSQKIAKEGEKHNIQNRHLLAVLAALFIPIAGFLVYTSYWIINIVFRNCQQVTETLSWGGETTYTSCNNPGGFLLTPLMFIIPLCILWYLYTTVQISRPFGRAVLVMILICILGAAEAFAGATLILTGVGGLGYLVAIPIIVGWISLLYHRHLGKDSAVKTSQNVSWQVPLQQTPTQSTNPVINVEDSHEPNPQPPQQNPPTTSS